MSKSSTAAAAEAASSTSFPAIKPEDYRHSPIHYAVAVGDHFTLSRLVSTLPRLADPSQIHTESDSLRQEKIADRIAAAIDRRDVPFRETPLHLAVRLSDSAAAKTLVGACADVTLHNSAGWSPLQEALCRRNSEIAVILLRHEHRSAWYKWRRRLPRVIAVLQRMRDFYMEISFQFESSVIPFIGKIAPSDTYKIWKRDGNLRADTSLAGFDGMKIQRADQSFLFLGEGDLSHDIPAGSLLVLNRDDRKVLNAFENADTPMSDSDLSRLCSQTSVYRPGMDVTKAELVGRTNWRRQEKTESVGEWKAKVYEMHNVVFSFRSRKVVNAENDATGSEQVLPLELDEDDDGFLVAENPSFGPPPSDGRRHSSFVREDTTRHSTAFVNGGRKSVDLPYAPISHRNRGATAVTHPQTKEKEFVRSLRPSVWLTEQFPLKTEELLPLLDILANKVKAVRRMRELLTTKFPPGTFPVKVAIPVVPTVRVVITFTKFVELPTREQFFTPISSPSLFSSGSERGNANEDKKSESNYFSLPSFSSSSSSSGSSWLRRSSSKSVGTSKEQHRSSSFSLAHQPDPFAIPEGYTWKSIDEYDKSQRMKRSKSVKKSK